MSTNPDDSRRQISSAYVVDRENRDEMARLVMQDQFVTRGMGGALPEQPDPLHFRRVLDIGCGTGGWLIEMAQTYPTATKLVGVDANARMTEYAKAQARAAQVDDRVEFEAMDALLMLEFPNGYFDLVNMRFGTSFVHTWNWPKLLSEIQRVTRVGGVIRLTETERMTASHSAPLRLPALLGSALFGAGHLFTEGQTTDTFTHGTAGVADDLTRLLNLHDIRNIQTRHTTLEFLPGTPEAQGWAEDTRLVFRAIIPFLQKWGHLPDNYEQIYQEALDAIQQPDYMASWTLLTAWGNR